MLNLTQIQPFKAQWHQTVTSPSVQCHPDQTYIFNFWLLGTLAISPERQSARMSEIKNVGYTWMAKCNQLTSLPFKGLTESPCHCRLSSCFVYPAKVPIFMIKHTFFSDTGKLAHINNTCSRSWYTITTILRQKCYIYILTSFYEKPRGSVFWKVKTHICCEVQSLSHVSFHLTLGGQSWHNTWHKRTQK